MVHGCVQNQECEDQIAWVDQRTIGMVDIVKQMWSLRRLLSEYKISELYSDYKNYKYTKF